MTNNTTTSSNFPVKGRSLDPAEWAGLSGCVAAGFTLGGFVGPVGLNSVQAPYLIACGLGIAFALCAISWTRGTLQSILVPLVLGLSALLLLMPTGGLAGPSSVAILWPILGAAALGQTLRTGVVLSAIVAVFLTVLTPQLGMGVSPEGGIWAGLCGLLVAAGFALAAVYRLAQDRAATKAQSQALAAQATQARDLALEEAKAARAQVHERSSFMAEMSHEIRTPLNAILGFADTMREGVFGPLPNAYADYPELIHRSGSHLLDLVSDLLDLSKIEAGRYQVNLVAVRLDEVAAEAIRLTSGLAQQSKVQLRHETTGAVEVQADPRALRQIALNLLSNALKFTPEGGRVTIRARMDADASGRPVPVLEVQDTGVGMSAENLAKLAEPWVQADNQSAPGAKAVRSSGLGLALVKRLAEMQGAQLKLTSEPGVGTRAQIVFQTSAS